MFDKITLDRIELMHPTIREQLKKDYLEINKNLPKGVRLRFTQTLRTIKEQDDLYAQGRTKKGKIVTNAKGGQSIHNFGLACFSDDTKILTKEGFKYFYELHEDEEVMTFKDGVMRYDKPLAIVSNDYEGDMIKVGASVTTSKANGPVIFKSGMINLNGGNIIIESGTTINKDTNFKMSNK